MITRELKGQLYVTGYDVVGDTLAEALSEAALITRDHENQNHLVRVNVEWDAETFEHHVFLTVLN